MSRFRIVVAALAVLALSANAQVSETITVSLDRKSVV